MKHLFPWQLFTPFWTEWYLALAKISACAQYPIRMLRRTRQRIIFLHINDSALRAFECETLCFASNEKSKIWSQVASRCSIPRDNNLNIELLKLAPTIPVDVLLSGDWADKKLFNSISDIWIKLVWNSEINAPARPIFSKASLQIDAES